MYDEIDYDAIRRRVNRRFWRWGTLGIHFVVWVVGVGVISTLASKETGEIIAIVWFGLMMLHGLAVVMTGLRDRAIERAIEHERRMLNAEKPKRSERLVLSDDGEVVELDPVNGTEKQYRADHNR